MNKKLIIAIALILHCKVTYSQTINSLFVGTYEDRIGEFTQTSLSLFIDGTFELTTPDPIFPYTHKNFKTTGIWVAAKNEVILNPDKQPRHAEVNLIQEKDMKADSIKLKINYKVKEFENEQLISVRPFEFEQMTVYINDKKKYSHLVRKPKVNHCLLAPRMKHQVLVDSTNTFKIPKIALSQIGIFTYGFGNPVELNVSNPASDYLEIDILQPIDIERTPRSKKVIIKGNKAYFYEQNGKVNTKFGELTKKR